MIGFEIINGFIRTHECYLKLNSINTIALRYYDTGDVPGYYYLSINDGNFCVGKYYQQGDAEYAIKSLIAEIH